MFRWIAEKFFKLTAKIIGSPADGYTHLWTGLGVGRDDITETCTVAHWLTRACCLHTHLYIWLCIHLQAHKKLNTGKKCMTLMHLVSWDTVRLTWLLHSLKRGPVITRHDCSTVTNLTMLSLQGAGTYTHKKSHRLNVTYFISLWMHCRISCPVLEM